MVIMGRSKRDKNFCRHVDPGGWLVPFILRLWTFDPPHHISYTQTKSSRHLGYRKAFLLSDR
jgi:hypothetical protein